VNAPKAKLIPPLLQGLQLPDPYLLSWPTYADRVMNEEDFTTGTHTFAGRAQVLKGVKGIFSKATTFAGLDLADRERIAGTVKKWPDTEPNWHWFGAMKSPPFRKSLEDRASKWSAALEAIPDDGPVGEQHYRRFLKEDPAKLPLPIAARSRLLAMKRPDTFVCVSDRNSIGLARAFGFGMGGTAINTQSYWNLIERIRATPWWNAPRPAASDEQLLWEGRAAFLDALYYVPKE